MLALLAEGLTNAEIAERLVVWPRTAEHHVAAVLTKLGAATRREAARRAAELVWSVVPDALLVGAQVDDRRDQVAHVRRDRDVVVAGQRLDQQRVERRLAADDPRLGAQAGRRAPASPTG